MKEREIPLKTQDIPGIGQGPAIDPAMQPVFDFRQQGGRGDDLAPVQQQMGRSQPPFQFAFKPRGIGRDHQGLFAGRFRKTHPGKQVRDVPVLHLLRAIIGHVQIQMLPDFAERLLGLVRFLLQTVRMLARDRLQQARVEGIALTSHLRQQRAQADRGIVRLWSGTADG